MTAKRAMLGVAAAAIVALGLAVDHGGAECEFTRRFRELIPGHEITVTVRDGGYIQRVTVGRLPQTEREEEEVRKKVEAFYVNYFDIFFGDGFIDNIERERRWFERYRVWGMGGIGGPPYFRVGIEENWMCPFRITELFYRFQEVSEIVGVGVIGRDIPIVFYETVPFEPASRTARHRPVFGGILVTNELGFGSTLCVAAV